jgi:hypothetical protein
MLCRFCRLVFILVGCKKRNAAINRPTLLLLRLFVRVERTRNYYENIISKLDMAATTTKKTSVRWVSPPCDMSFERNRLNSFDHHWPHNQSAAQDLAKYGFYYLDSERLRKYMPDSMKNITSDTVQCAFCFKSFSRFHSLSNTKSLSRCNLVIPYKPGDSALESHKKLSPHCPFICGIPTSNIPLVGKQPIEMASLEGWGKWKEESGYGKDEVD